MVSEKTKTKNNRCVHGIFCFTLDTGTSNSDNNTDNDNTDKNNMATAGSTTMVPAEQRGWQPYHIANHLKNY